MKKLTGFIAAAGMMIALSACTGKSAPEPTTAAPAKETAQSQAQTEPSETKTEATGQEVKWPTGTVTIYVPGKAGANLDTKARLTAKYLGGELTWWLKTGREPGESPHVRSI